MAEHHMSAREAWEIVKDGTPLERVHFSRTQLDSAMARYARACAIVEANLLALAEHPLERLSAENLEAWANAYGKFETLLKKARALERGEGG